METFPTMVPNNESPFQTTFSSLQKCGGIRKRRGYGSAERAFVPQVDSLVTCNTTVNSKSAIKCPEIEQTQDGAEIAGSEDEELLLSNSPKIKIIEKDDESGNELDSESKEITPMNTQKMSAEVDEHMETNQNSGDKEVPVNLQVTIQSQSEIGYKNYSQVHSQKIDSDENNNLHDHLRADNVQLATELTFDLIQAVDELFKETDPDKVTVKLFNQSLEARVGYNLPKQIKKLVKERLFSLLSGDFDASANEEEQANSSDEGNESDADDEYEEEAPTKRRAPRKSRKSKAASSQRQSDAEDFDDESEEAKQRYQAKSLSQNSERPNRKTRTKKSELRDRVKTVRQKASEEAKVLQQEMEGMIDGEGRKIHAEDKRRQEAIIARLEADDEQLELLREQDRSNLLQKLFEKKRALLDLPSVYSIDETEAVSRLAVDSNDVKSETKVELSMQANVQEIKPFLEHVSDEISLDESDSDSDDESESDLQVVLGPKQQKSALAALCSRVKPENCKNEHSEQTRNKLSFVDPRTQLRNKLRAKARSAGNAWLAKELGYKTEQDHLEDCQLAVQRRKEIIQKQELKKRQMQLKSPFIHPEIDFDRDEEEEGVAEAVGDDIAPHVSDEEIELAAAIASEKESNHRGADEDLTVNRVQEILPQGTDEIHSEGFSEDILSHLAEAKESEQAKVTEIDGPTDISESADTDIDNGGGAAFENETICDLNKQLEETQSDLRTATQDFQLEKSELSEKKRIDRNAGWKALLEKEANMVKKKMSKRAASGMIEEEASEEEEEVAAAGLEDFGFGAVQKKRAGDSDDEAALDQILDDDLDGIVDELSDNEGDEQAGEEGRKKMHAREEKERHKEILRRMRDGYDGRRGGIASGNARGVHRFDQLISADDKDEARRLGLLNDDESESDAEQQKSDDEEEDEALLIDKMLKDRFMNKADVGILFSGDESEDEDETSQLDTQPVDAIAQEEAEQARLAKRFAKRARMNRFLEVYGDSQQESESQILDEDESLKNELKSIMDISRSRIVSAVSSSASDKPESSNVSKISISLTEIRSKKRKTTFLQSKASSSKTSSYLNDVSKSLVSSHATFQSSENSQLGGNRIVRKSRPGHSQTSFNNVPKKPVPNSSAGSLWSKVSSSGFKR